VVKYDGKTNLSVWLEDYHLACREGGADDKLFIIQFLPIYLADTARAWLDHLPRNTIDSWEDLTEIFTDNFSGTYVRPDNPWDLKGCRQKSGESLMDYIWQFSGNFHKLSKISDTDIISAFWFGSSYRTLVHKLGSDQSKTTKELLDITTQHAFGEEAVGAVLVQSDGKTVPSSSVGHRPKFLASTLREEPKAAKRDKSGTPTGRCYYR
jgi:hypothetical protein